MTAGVLSKLGLDFGPTIRGSSANRKGFFENDNIRAKLKNHIERAGGHREGQYGFPDPAGSHPITLRQDIFGALKGAVAYKDAKICLLAETWVEAFPESLYVFVRRDLDGIAKSCLRTGFMQAHQDIEGWKRWAQYYIDCVERMKPHVEYIEVWPDGGPDVFKPVAEFAGIQWDRRVVDKFVDANLWNRFTR